MSKGHMNKLEEANSGPIWVKWTVINSHELQQTEWKKKSMNSNWYLKGGTQSSSS